MTTINHEHFGSIPTEFYKDGSPIAYTVAELIIQLERLPGEMPLEAGEGYEIQVVNIKTDTPFVSLVEPF